MRASCYPAQTAQESDSSADSASNQSPNCPRRLDVPIFAAMAIQIRTSLAEPETGETFVPHRPARPDKAEGGRPFVLEVGL